MYICKGQITGGKSAMETRASRWDEKEIQKLRQQEVRCESELKALRKSHARDGDMSALEMAVCTHL